MTFDVNQLEQLDKINIFGNRSRLLQLIVESFLNQELTVADLIKKRREAVQT